VVAFIVRAEARTYLRNNRNDRRRRDRNDSRDSNGEKQIPFGDDNKKDNSNDNGNSNGEKQIPFGDDNKKGNNKKDNSVNPRQDSLLRQPVNLRPCADFEGITLVGLYRYIIELYVRIADRHADLRGNVDIL